MRKTKEIGGFLELELNDSSTLYHDDVIAVNTGRNALEYILKVNQYTKVYIPYYTCEAVLEVIEKLNIPFSFYTIKEDLSPDFYFENMNENEGFVYTNYFGLCKHHIENIAVVCPNLILDNAQAFFHKSTFNIPAIYSPRKFFGVADGGFLYNNKELDIQLEKDHSLKRLRHLAGRIEESAANFYVDYQKSEAALQGEPIKEMSNLTKKILNSIDYGKISVKRQRNYATLYKVLKVYNELDFPEITDEIPLCYPLLLKNGAEVKQKLIRNKIYVPTYWPNVFEWAEPNSFEYNLAENLVCLPIDHRYGKPEMEKIIAVLNLNINE